MPGEFLHGRARARQRARATAEAEAPHASGVGRPRPLEPDRRMAAYRALGVSAGASRSEVQRAFRRLAAQHHPDRHPQAGATEKARLLSRFVELSAAYHALTA
jgi:DnaJ-class molecular chaperone